MSVPSGALVEAGGDLVEIVVAVYQGAPYLADFLASLQAQTHRDWRLWVRDDGSTDASLTTIARVAESDPRVRIHPSDGRRLGATRGFAWLLDQVPADAEYVMFADQDDVWLPGKISRTLAAMKAAEAATPGPVLVHTDLAVVDDELREIHPSFWRFSHVDPEPATLRRIVVQNVATGATAMVNRPLREAVGPIPEGALYHDWWIACAAAVFGRIVAVREATILYRQHQANVVGARAASRPTLRELPGVAQLALRRSTHMRTQLARTAAQAGAFLDRYGPQLAERDRRFLAAFARIPQQPLLRRKLEVARLRLRREDGFWRNLGVVLRA